MCTTTQVERPMAFSNHTSTDSESIYGTLGISIYFSSVHVSALKSESLVRRIWHCSPRSSSLSAITMYVIPIRPFSTRWQRLTLRRESDGFLFFSNSASLAVTKMTGYSSPVVCLSVRPHQMYSLYCNRHQPLVALQNSHLPHIVHSI